MSLGDAAAYAKANLAGDLLDTEGALVLSGVLRGARSYEDSKAEFGSIQSQFDDYGGFVSGSEAEYRTYEVVCPVYHLTFHKDLKECPHCEGQHDYYRMEAAA